MPAALGLIVGGLIGYAGVTPPWGVATGLAIAWAGFALRGAVTTPAEAGRAGELRTPLHE